MTTAQASQTTTHVKRKSSASGLPTGGRTVKRRASKACHCCRGRKVRCDVVESGIPCTNCRLDEVECVVTEGKRRRKSYVEGELFQNSPTNSVEEDKETLHFPIFDDIEELNTFIPALPTTDSQQLLRATEDDLIQHKPHMLYQTQGHRLSKEERTRRLSVISTHRLSPPISLSATMSYFPQQSLRPDITLPAYVRAIPPRILTEDLDYLQKKGAFLVPETNLRNELLRCYVQYVHPFLPIIDLQDFLSTIEKNQSTGTVSLLLFQAVMFAGTAYIDMRYLLAQGYMTRKAARKSFFERVKLLYDFDYEVDRVTVVQAVLLMTYWYESPDDSKDVWHWLGIAISVARTIGLNCDTSDAPLMCQQQRRLWKRIWWSCYMRDRLIALGMRRPMRINDGDADVPMLELDDFETEALRPELSKMLGGCPAVKDCSKRITLAKMCIGLAQLCACITQILAVQYSTLGHKIGATQETTMRLVPKRCAADPAQVVQCDDELDKWHERLPKELRYYAPDSCDRTVSTDGEVINLHRALLAGVFLTTISALHRPQILPSAPDVVVAPELRDLSKAKVRKAADDITEMYKELLAHDMIRYLPNTGVTCLLPAIIIHLLDIKSADNNTRQASVRKFQFCMQALQRLREMYASADFAFSFLDAAVRKTNANVSAASDMKSPVSSNAQVLDQKNTANSQLLLTPPPEAMQTASLLLLNSTLAPEERNLIAAYTPRTPSGSDASLQYHTTAGAAAALTDLPSGHPGELDDEAEEANFDSLVDLDGGVDVLSMVENSMDLSMQWLQGYDAEKLSPFAMETIEEREEHAVRAGYIDQTSGVSHSVLELET